MAAMPASWLPWGRRRLLLVVAGAATAAGALAALVVLARRLRLLLAGDVLLADQGAYYTVALQDRMPLTHNVRLLRFSLPDPSQRLGLRPCEHVYLHAHLGGRVVVRPYTPVSLCDQRGTFDLIVKVYAGDDSAAVPGGGVMSQYLDQLAPGDEIQVQGPKGRFVYEGRGRFALVRDPYRRLPPAARLGLIAAGSGITPMLQLLRHMFAEPLDRTDVVMVDVNSTQDDIIAREELEGYAQLFSRNFSIWHVLSKLPATGAPANFLQGRLTTEILAARLPPPGADTMVLCCGPPRLISEVCKPALRDIGHSAEQVLIF
ncbi:NADH-cytochrome b5 reductase 3-like [Dermacentor andersoni]|uniref:NADH-cytochrome b5 reductase 3-like n=1 Tax=Dermacentor andersoni TaxID=34620 RepID=UPI0021553C71|nr:NADH-cytochrome b5 reductase 3-like [Dermacentor andersoni]